MRQGRLPAALPPLLRDTAVFCHIGFLSPGQPELARLSIIQSKPFQGPTHAKN